MLQGDSGNALDFEDSADFSKWDKQEIKKVYTSIAYLQGIQRLIKFTTLCVVKI